MSEHELRHVLGWLPNAGPTPFEDIGVDPRYIIFADLLALGSGIGDPACDFGIDVGHVPFYQPSSGAVQ